VFKSRDSPIFKNNSLYIAKYIYITAYNMLLFEIIQYIRCKMKSKFKRMQLETLNQHLASIQIPERPLGGWIKAIRKALGMKARHLADRLGVKEQSVLRFEANEVDDSITLKSLRRVAEVMECQLVYALVPQPGSLQKIIQEQAYKKATELVTAVDHTMMLEGQATGEVQSKIREIAEELATQPNSKLWD
jgi:predicted DNA-binding mobile mystery protein A